MCLQLVNRLISSPTSKSYRHTTCRRPNCLPELHQWQDFTDQNRQYWRVFRHLRLRFGLRNVGFQEIGETQKVKERENEFLDETQSDTGIAPSPSPTVKQ
uniref:Uncharacterized protein n=1 Tax=Vitis vinifera TaxID=29760 RepID=A5C4L3_VITVI|nr:hypothetical protein VITISV_014744 [Vitis vinifera]